MEDLAFVIGGAACEEFAIAEGGFEGRGFPELEGFGGLDVVVTVDEHGGFAGVVWGVAQDDGVAWSGK